MDVRVKLIVRTYVPYGMSSDVKNSRLFLGMVRFGAWNEPEETFSAAESTAWTAYSETVNGT